ncbi:MAG: GNAT family N-acetyltransferase [Candidatus Methylomirabilis oxyfera]|nr:GNAT family N-acetyltransferase [Candidatus Methylomirabilis oxyfera]
MSHRPQLALTLGDERLATVEALAQGLLQEGKACRLITVFTWEPLEGFSAAGFKTTKAGETVLLRLSVANDADIFKKLSATKRNCIRQAERKGVQIKDTYDSQEIDELLDAFDEIHHKHRLPLRSRADLEALLKLDRNRKLFIAKAEDRVIAGTIIRFARRGLAEYSENVSLERMRHYHPNEVLLWHAIR